MIETPTLDKLQGVHDLSNKCGEFLDWLQGEKGLVLCQPHQHREPDEASDDPEGCRMGYRTYQCGLRAGQLLPAQTGGTEQLLAEFFEIDLAAVEREKRALLAEIRGATL